MDDPQKLPSLKGKVAVVTGAASGIGRCIAIQLASQRADLFLHTRSNKKGLQATKERAAQLGANCETMLADFSNREQQDRFCEAAWAWQNRIDILVCNAGADVLTGATADWDFEQKMDLLVEVDLISTMRISRSLGELLRGVPNSAIVHIGWDQAEHGMEGDSGQMFGAIKSSVMAFSKSLAKTLAPNVRVNCVAPGWVQTAWGETTSDYWDTRAKREALLFDWGRPQDIASTIGYLVSPAARFINGQVIAVNGGFNHGAAGASRDGK